MILNIVKIISTAIDELGRRVPKFLRNGRTDVQTSLQVGPAGNDSNPIKDMIAVYGPTSNNGDTVILGYINRNQLAAPGEHRTFSTNATGTLKFYIWQKADGTCELGGSSKHLTRFEELETGFNQLKSDLNSLILLYNSHIHPTPAGPSSPTTSLGTSSTASIAGAKIIEIKTM